MNWVVLIFLAFAIYGFLYFISKLFEVDNKIKRIDPEQEMKDMQEIANPKDVYVYSEPVDEVQDYDEDDFVK